MINNNEKTFYFYVSIVLMGIVAVILAHTIFLESKLSKNELQNVIDKFFMSAVEITVENSAGNIAHGSGFVIEEGRIISAAHMFGDVANINVKFYDETNCTASVLRIDVSKDLALLIFDSSNKEFPKVDFAAKTDLKFGDKIVKFGNAMNYGLSVDEGIISNPYKRIEVEDNLRELVQISIDICGGDSGGAVLNSCGQFVGVISFKTSSDITADRELSFIVPSFVIVDFLKTE